jgi:F0F1-type ATP synthase membrane subunit a
VPSGLAKPVYILLIPIEIMGMFVKPFALTMRLAANMTGGHIAILAILSFVFLFTEMFETFPTSYRRRSSGRRPRARVTLTKPEVMKFV